MPHFGEVLREQVRGDEYGRGDAVIDDHGADEISGLAKKLQAAERAIVIHGEHALKEVSLTAARAAEAQPTPHDVREGWLRNRHWSHVHTIA